MNNTQRNLRLARRHANSRKPVWGHGKEEKIKKRTKQAVEGWQVEALLCPHGHRDAAVEEAAPTALLEFATRVVDEKTLAEAVKSAAGYDAVAVEASQFVRLGCEEARGGRSSSVLPFQLFPQLDESLPTFDAVLHFQKRRLRFQLEYSSAVDNARDARAEHGLAPLELQPVSRRLRCSSRRSTFEYRLLFLAHIDVRQVVVAAQFLQVSAASSLLSILEGWVELLWDRDCVSARVSADLRVVRGGNLQA